MVIKVTELLLDPSVEWPPTLALFSSESCSDSDDELMPTPRQMFLEMLDARAILAQPMKTPAKPLAFPAKPMAIPAQPMAIPATRAASHAAESANGAPNVSSFVSIGNEPANMIPVDLDSSDDDTVTPCVHFSLPNRSHEETRHLMGILWPTNKAESVENAAQPRPLTPIATDRA